MECGRKSRGLWFNTQGKGRGHPNFNGCQNEELQQHIVRLGRCGKIKMLQQRKKMKLS